MSAKDYIIPQDDLIKYKLFANYADNVFAYINNQKIKNEYTGELLPPDEGLMQSVEKHVIIGFHNGDNFRSSFRSYVVNTCLALHKDDKLRWDCIPLTIREAIEAKLYEDNKPAFHPHIPVKSPPMNKLIDATLNYIKQINKPDVEIIDEDYRPIEL